MRRLGFIGVIGAAMAVATLLWLRTYALELRVTALQATMPGQRWDNVRKTLGEPRNVKRLKLKTRSLTAYYFQSAASGPLVGKDMVWLVDDDGFVTSSVWCSHSNVDDAVCAEMIN